MAAKTAIAKSAAQGQSPTALAPAAAPFPDLSLNNALTFSYGSREIASSGLRQFGGWIREEFLPQLLGRQAARVYREMQDNDPTIGSLLFAIKQSMRSVEWNVEPANDSPEAEQMAEFVDGLMNDMSEPWDQVLDEILSMLPFGYAPMEMVFKRRVGPDTGDGATRSKFTDGKIGFRKLAVRGQETILKWYLNQNGGIEGLQQMPYIGSLIDLPISKFLLFRPSKHKNNPEGRSILRTSYRSYYFVKRMQEQEAIIFERMGGIPKITLPKAIIDLSMSTATGNPEVAAARALYAQAQSIARNIRIDEQMGLVWPSDVDPNTKAPLFGFELVSPQISRAGVNGGEVIERHKLDMVSSVLADWISLGHQAKGAYNLATAKIDMFYMAIEGWLTGVAEVINQYGLPPIWTMNGLPRDLMPHIKPEMNQRVDLDALSNYVLRLGQVGFLSPTTDTENFLRRTGNMPELPEGDELDINGGPVDDLAQKVKDRLLNDPAMIARPQPGAPQPGAPGAKPNGAAARPAQKPQPKAARHR